MDGRCEKKAKFSNSCDDYGLPALKVKRLSELAYLPTRGSALAAGYDLYRCVRLIIIWRWILVIITPFTL